MSGYYTEEGEYYYSEDSYRFFSNPENAKPGPVNSSLSCWIDRNGGFRNVPHFQHERWAKDFMNCDARTLELRGWIHVSSSFLYCKRSFTQSQIDTLYDIAEALERIDKYSASEFRRSIQYSIEALGDE